MSAVDDWLGADVSALATPTDDEFVTHRDAQAFWLRFYLFDELTVDREHLLDDLSGAPYTPWRPIPGIDQIAVWQQELATVVSALAAVEQWAAGYRHWALQQVLLEPGTSILWSLNVLRQRLAVAAGSKTG